MLKGVHYTCYDKVPTFNDVNEKYCILGSTFCEKNRIDLKYHEWMNIIDLARQNYENILIQQPFYLINDQYYNFFSCIKDCLKRGWIDGVIVNSYGMAKKINEEFDINQVVSRYTIGKRNMLNRYYIDLMLDLNIIAWEVFPSTYDVMAELLKYKDKLSIWKRETKYKVNSIARQCFLSNSKNTTENICESCNESEYLYISKNKEINFKISGHILLEENDNIDFAQPDDVVLIKTHDEMEL